MKRGAGAVFWLVLGVTCDSPVPSRHCGRKACGRAGAGYGERIPSARVFAMAVLMTLTACGGASQEGEPGSRSAEDYPIVTEEEVAHTADGHPVPPDSYSAEPSASCERKPYKSDAGPGYFVAPPRPGLTAKALDERLVEVTWSFRSLPADCRPVGCT
jgi:hypothetical protein